MTITAQFPCKCSCCGFSIKRGERIEWTPGDKNVTHAFCAKIVASERIATVPVDARTEEVYSVTIAKRSQGDYEVTLKANRQPAGGFPKRYTQNIVEPPDTVFCEKRIVSTIEEANALVEEAKGMMK